VEISFCPSHHNQKAAHKNLVEEVLDELLLERSRSEEAMQVGSEQFGDKIAVRWRISEGCSQGLLTDIHVFQRRDEDVAEADHLIMALACCYSARWS
jgi:hypothetical protein